MSKEFTRGPWFAYKRPEPVGYAEYEIHYGTSGECIAEVVHGEGNAHLLASAPDLLDALNRCLARILEECADAEHLDDVFFARAVIEKAKGK